MAAACVLFLLLCGATSALHESSVIPVPSSLSPRTNSSAWRSPSGLFAFGFYETPDGYAICIFLAGFSETTVVWTAHRNGSFLPITNVYSLEINHDAVELSQSVDGKYYAYNLTASLQEAIAGASMLDNGNFVLYGSNGSVIWQSFDYPTDTLLPGQRLPPDGELVSGGSGAFRLKMQLDGNLVQYPFGAPDTPENAYYDTGVIGAASNVSLILENDAHLYLSDGNFVSYDLSSGGRPVGGSIALARVDPDGIFRLYNRSLGREGNWTSIWSSTEDRCAPKGICGVNSICSYHDHIVTCTCFLGFGNTSSGCRENFNAQDCGNKNPIVKYEIKTIPNVTWIDNYYGFNYTETEQECGRACLDDCDCVVALFKDGQCRKQRSPLRYGRMSTNDSSMAVVRVTLPAVAPPDDSGKAVATDGSGFGKGVLGSSKRLSDVHKHVIIGVSIGITLLVISSFIITYIRKQSAFCSQDEESIQNVNKLVLNHGSLAPRRYSYKEIKKITKSFTQKLGHGGYGTVYKGQLLDGQLVAVKVLTMTHGNADEFVNEVASISRTSHVNIVNLLGFCFERKKRALVYQFMPNKSLDKFIYKSGSVDPECSLEWKKLYEISVGVARGLEYLHRGCNTRIVHFDIKPHNILLDQDFCPKISDFGLAKLCMSKQSIISMLGTRGTIGYIAPEVFSRNFGVVSHKSDVYSYGIMLLQMVEARTNVEVKSLQSSENFFLEEIYEHVLVQNEKAYSLMTEEEEEVVRKMLMVGFWCIQTAPSDRPSMDNVVDMLAGNLQSIQIPPLPFLLSSPKQQFSCLLPVTVESRRSLLNSN